MAAKNSTKLLRLPFLVRRAQPAAVARNLCTVVAPAPTEESDQKPKPTGDRKELYRRLSKLGGAPEGSISKTMNKWVREGKQPRVNTLVKYVKELRKYKRYQHALELMDWMVTKGMNLSHSNSAIYLELTAKVKDIDSAEGYFNGLPDAAKNQQTYGALLSCYCSTKMEEKASNLYGRMDDLGMTSTTLVQNNMMTLYLKLGLHDKVVNQLQAMKAKGIAPDNHTCCIVLTSYASVNQIDSIDEFMKEIEGQEVVRSWTVYGTLASIYISSGHIEKAEPALKKLEERLDSHDREGYHFLMSLHPKTGNLSEVKRVWEVLKAKFKKLTNTDYRRMLEALIKLGDIETAEQVFNEWESKPESYDIRLANLMIGTYLRAGRTAEAEKVWEKASGRGIRFDFRTCELFMDHYLQSKDVSLALSWLGNAASIVEADNWKLEEDRASKFRQCLQEAGDVKLEENFTECLKKVSYVDPRA